MSELRFAEPLAFKPLPGNRLLVQHAPTGAWVMIEESDRAIVEALAFGVNSGGLDAAAAGGEAILEPFIRAGLVTASVECGQAKCGQLRLAPVRMLILKMVGYCNLACTYCYDYDRSNYTRRLSPDDARRAISQALDLSDGVLQILFHGGEPLLALDHVRSLTDYANAEADARGRKLQFSIQTNGTRFTDDAVEFLLREKFGIGLSLDGPPALNDVHRIDHRSRGSGDGIERSLRAHPELLESIGVLTTITSANVNHLIEVARYVRDLGLRAWDATVFQSAGRGETRSDAMAPGSGEVVRAYLELLDAIDADEFDDFRICPILHYLHNLLYYARNNICLRGGGCGAARELISIAADGRIEACDCIKDPALSLGSLGKTDLATARTGPVAQAIRGRTEDSLLPCASCDLRSYCGGTCLATAGALQAVDETGCALSMALFPEIFRRLAISDRLERYARRHP